MLYDILSGVLVTYRKNSCFLKEIFLIRLLSRSSGLFVCRRREYYAAFYAAKQKDARTIRRDIYPEGGKSIVNDSFRNKQRGRRLFFGK